MQPDNQDFELTYISIGFGSNFSSMQPVFRVKGSTFYYESRQTSYYEGQPLNKPDTLQVGKFRRSSADSILALVRDIKDTLVYKTNVHVMSGGVHEISIRTSTKRILFRLHNATDSTAKKIVAILNNYIEDKDQKLWLYDIEPDPR